MLQPLQVICKGGSSSTALWIRDDLVGLPSSRGVCHELCLCSDSAFCASSAVLVTILICSVAPLPSLLFNILLTNGMCYRAPDYLKCSDVRC